MCSGVFGTGIDFACSVGTISFSHAPILSNNS